MAAWKTHTRIRHAHPHTHQTRTYTHTSIRHPQMTHTHTHTQPKEKNMPASFQKEEDHSSCVQFSESKKTDIRKPRLHLLIEDHVHQCVVSEKQRLNQQRSYAFIFSQCQLIAQWQSDVTQRGQNTLIPIYQTYITGLSSMQWLIEKLPLFNIYISVRVCMCARVHAFMQDLGSSKKA